MADQVNINDIDLTTRAFNLLCKLSENGGLTPAENLELLQIQKKMAASEIVPLLQSGLESLGERIDSITEVLASRIDAQDAKIDAQNSKIDAQNSKIEAMNTKIEAMNTKIEAVNTKQNILIVVIAIIGSALTIVLSLS